MNTHTSENPLVMQQQRHQLLLAPTLEREHMSSNSNSFNFPFEPQIIMNFQQAVLLLFLLLVVMEIPRQVVINQQCNSSGVTYRFIAFSALVLTEPGNLLNKMLKIEDCNLTFIGNCAEV